MFSLIIIQCWSIGVREIGRKAQWLDSGTISLPCGEIYSLRSAHWNGVITSARLSQYNSRGTQKSLSRKNSASHELFAC